MSDQNDKLKNLKTSSVDRRLSIAKASLLAGTRWATASATSMFSSEEEKRRNVKKRWLIKPIIWSLKLEN